jgi:hypothetical protein
MQQSQISRAGFISLTHLGGDSRSGGDMLPSQGPAQDAESVRAMILIVAAGVAIFWKQALRVLLALIVIAVGVGAFMLLQGVHG